jgi:hypothetical protein
MGDWELGRKGGRERKRRKGDKVTMNQKTVSI